MGLFKVLDRLKKSLTLPHPMRTGRDLWKKVVLYYWEKLSEEYAVEGFDGGAASDMNQIASCVLSN